MIQSDLQGKPRETSRNDLSSSAVTGSNNNVDTVELISQTVDFAGLEWEDILPENMDSEDEKVWQSIMESNVGVFQWEGERKPTLNNRSA